jgi:hypothetical protein
MSGAVVRISIRTGVEAPGIEPSATGSSRVANSRENDAKDATRDYPKRREVSALSEGPTEPPRIPADPDEALRVAIVAAVYAGDTGRARALLDVLDAKPERGAVLALAQRKGRKYPSP